MHIFCIKCFKDANKKGGKKKKNKSCPMCAQEFAEIHVPKPVKTYKELYQEIKVIGTGAFGKAVLIK